MFECLECGWKTSSVKAAERAAFGDKGCPKCGGSDIDLAGTASPEALAAFESEFDFLTI